jgi:uncharacterized protein (TIGR03437 family)
MKMETPIFLQRWKTTLATALCAVAYSQLGLAQLAPHTILNVNTENVVQYVSDVSDVSMLATNPNVTAAAVPKTFQETTFIGDIVSVNGQVAKGLFVVNRRLINSGTARTPGQAIADVMRSDVSSIAFEILKGDGTPVGTIHVSALGGPGPAPPGAPLAVTQGNNAIVGGTGAFLGARGQQGQSVTSQTITPRVASMTEDPANRRQNGGGRLFFVLDVIPMSVPQIVTTSGGPAVTHSSDFTLVTASKPAAAGEILSVFVTGLGPTRPGVDPGKPFPANPPAVVNSPIMVTVNGEAAQVIGAVGYPEAVDAYQVNFQVPSDTTKGAATIQLSAAWIAGPAVNIPIQ